MVLANPSFDATSHGSDPRLPQLITELPGPKTRALIEKDHTYLSPSYTRGYPLSIERGEGAIVVDVDGNRFLDFCAGIAVCATGHSHPEVVEVIREQAGRFLHMSGTDFYYQSMADLAERLAQTALGDSPKRVFFGNSGAEANEGAIKLARFATGRQALIAFYGSFHGRTLGALTLGASKSIQKKRFMPLLPGVYHAPYPNPYRDPWDSQTPEETAERCLDYIERTLFRTVVNPDEVAAFVVEPLQGEGGYVVPPANFLPGLQALARKHGILIIVDEVQAGMGRTGKLWASEHFPPFEPDIISSAKGLASGLPLGAVIARADLMTWPPGAHASTFGGNPVSCVAALKTMDLLEGGLMANATRQGDRLMAGLRAVAETTDVIGEVRGLGLMVGMEIVQSASTCRCPSSSLRDAIVDACFHRGLLVLGCGESTIRFCPPLIVDDLQVETAVQIVADAVRSLS